MADLAAIDRLQPCLLDRLTDEQPSVQVESRNQRVISLSRFKEGVLRDLSWLLNTQRHRESEGLDEYDQVYRSVLNYGMRDLAGIFSEGGDLRQIEREISETILFFEPRIIRRTLQVKILKESELESQRNPHRIFFQISADLWAQPMPEKFYAKTVVDLETGQFSF
ncbi:MAG TPA: type VI secretion system baseplate subunit TssE [Opitutaceae bacterium]|jgi:type VI secretion system protein ImpF|nr:type VI secretion system baseplate subunit TssE [Opitutaceae bacterium]HRE06014.1 type VI secretion system baseplate subunit TssE [Opitutaceae bacterium]